MGRLRCVSMSEHRRGPRRGRDLHRRGQPGAAVVVRRRGAASISPAPTTLPASRSPTTTTSGPAPSCTRSSRPRRGRANGAAASASGKSPAWAQRPCPPPPARRCGPPPGRLDAVVRRPASPVVRPWKTVVGPWKTAAGWRVATRAPRLWPRRRPRRQHPARPTSSELPSVGVCVHSSTDSSSDVRVARAFRFPCPTTRSPTKLRQPSARLLAGSGMGAHSELRIAVTCVTTLPAQRTPRHKEDGTDTVVYRYGCPSWWSGRRLALTNSRLAHDL